MLCVKFSTKSKATNVFPKHILKSKACDQSIQTRKKLLCHVIVKNYFCNVLCKVFIKLKNKWRCQIKEQILQLTLLYCGSTVKSSHQSSSIKLFLTPALECLFFKKLQAFRTATLLKRDSNKDVFQLILQKI